jgi:hypothetical protein
LLVFLLTFITLKSTSMLKKPFKAAMPALLFVAMCTSVALYSCASAEEKKEESTETVAPATPAVDSPATMPGDTSKKDTMDDASTRPVVPPNKAN